MTSILSKATIDSVANPLHKYRWELTLFIGIPLVVDVISLAVWELRVLGSEVPSISHVTAHYAVAGIVKMAALGILWWRVHHLGRPYFSLLVLYAFFVAFPGVEVINFWKYWCSLQHPIHVLQQALAGKNAINAEEYAALVDQVRHITPDWYCVSDYVVFTILTYVSASIKLALLIWFAWMASRFSMFHAAVFIGLSTALGGVFGYSPSFVPTILGHLIVTSIKYSNYGFWVPKSFEQLSPLSALVAFVAQIVLCCVAVRVLGGFNHGMDLRRKVITFTAVLLILATLMQAIYKWDSWFIRTSYTFDGSATAILYYLRSPEAFILSYALVFAITYVAWRLFPSGDVGDSGSTPTDTSPPRPRTIL